MKLNDLARLSLGFYPTPLEEMPSLRKALGRDCPRLFAKRDDYTGFAFGGNKVRKVEFALRREIDRGVSTVVTIGGEKSNHARITAAACAKTGIKCILVLNRVGNGDAGGHVPASRQAYEMFGAEVRWVSSRDEREPTAIALAAELNNENGSTAYLPLGLSMPVGAVGYVHAYREMKEQFARLGLHPDHIFHSSSSGGTQAGLVAGHKLFGERETRIVGVSPDDPADEIAAYVAEIANGAFDELGATSLSVSARDVTVLDEFIGGGYGVATSGSLEAETLFARTEGIILDPLYTSKAAAAMIASIREGKIGRDETVLFWHTGGQLAHFYAPVARAMATTESK